MSPNVAASQKRVAPLNISYGEKKKDCFTLCAIIKLKQLYRLEPELIISLKASCAAGSSAVTWSIYIYILLLNGASRGKFSGLVKHGICHLSRCSLSRPTPDTLLRCPAKPANPCIPVSYHGVARLVSLRNSLLVSLADTCIFARFWGCAGRGGLSKGERQ